eukprot:773857-Amphidinium_carterae.2
MERASCRDQLDHSLDASNSSSFELVARGYQQVEVCRTRRGSGRSARTGGGGTTCKVDKRAVGKREHDTQGASKEARKDGGRKSKCRKRKGEGKREDK